jgi:hypothetical protein
MKDKFKNGWFVSAVGLGVVAVILFSIGLKLDARVAAQTTPPYTFIQHDGVVIECIAYDGVVEALEPDEYVQIYNQGNSPVRLTNWQLRDVTDGAAIFTFPDSEIKPGQRLRVYTNELHPEWTGFQSGGFSFGALGNQVWDNDIAQYDVAGLFDAGGNEIGKAGYPAGCEPGTRSFRLYPWGAFVKFIDVTGVEQSGHVRHFNFNGEAQTWIFGLETLGGLMHAGIPQEHLLHNVPEPPSDTTPAPQPPTPTPEPPTPTPTEEPPTEEPPTGGTTGSEVEEP